MNYPLTRRQHLILDALRDGQWHDLWAIYKACGQWGIPDQIAHMKRAGYPIEQAKGGPAVRYRLVKKMPRQIDVMAGH